jgi:hypothetical protein
VATRLLFRRASSDITKALMVRLRGTSGIRKYCGLFLATLINILDLTLMAAPFADPNWAARGRPAISADA